MFQCELELPQFKRNADFERDHGIVCIMYDHQQRGHPLIAEGERTSKVYSQDDPKTELEHRWPGGL